MMLTDDMTFTLFSHLSLLSLFYFLPPLELFFLFLFSLYQLVEYDKFNRPNKWLSLLIGETLTNTHICFIIFYCLAFFWTYSKGNKTSLFLIILLDSSLRNTSQNFQRNDLHLYIFWPNKMLQLRF